MCYYHNILSPYNEIMYIPFLLNYNHAYHVEIYFKVYTILERETESTIQFYTLDSIKQADTSKEARNKPGEEGHYSILSTPDRHTESM